MWNEVIFFSFLGDTQPCSGLTPALYSGVTPDSIKRALWDARDLNWVGCVQGNCSPLYHYSGPNRWCLSYAKKTVLRIETLINRFKKIIVAFLW